jgi:hypothetical protein
VCSASACACQSLDGSHSSAASSSKSKRDRRKLETVEAFRGRGLASTSSSEELSMMPLSSDRRRVGRSSSMSRSKELLLEVASDKLRMRLPRDQMEPVARHELHLKEVLRANE